MSEMKPTGYLITARDGGRFFSFSGAKNPDTIPLYTADQLAEAVAERDALIRDLRKELNERRYGRSAEK